MYEGRPVWRICIWDIGLNVQQVVKAVLELVASKLRVLGFNPLSPNGDQHQFSPKDIYTLSRD